MINQVYNQTMSLFFEAFMFALHIFLMIVIPIIKLVVPVVVCGVVLIGKAVLLFIVLMIVTIWTYWRNISILENRLRNVNGLFGYFQELRLYCEASIEELTYQRDPFSVAIAVQGTRFYQQYIAFVDVPYGDHITIMNFMSQGWIAQTIDRGLTRLVKVAIPVTNQMNNIAFTPFHMLTSLID